MSLDVVDQKRENLLNLALSASEEERLKSENLEIGYDPEDKTWELILRYSGNLNRLRELSDQGVTVRELFNGYAIARVPQGLLDQVSGIREIQYIEKPKRLFFAMDMAKAASCLLGIQPGRREEGIPVTTFVQRCRKPDGSEGGSGLFGAGAESGALYG